jgi:class 3 adenylate cyclase/tetratricopeptide (TPR) repeat protein
LTRPARPASLAASPEGRLPAWNVPSAGRKSARGPRFCEDCGARLALACSQCGAELASGKKFCGSCGAPAESKLADRFTSRQGYTPKHLAEKILISKSTLEGERKQVTVLFADLKGSMELLADRDPEDARKLLDPVLERMMEAVHRYEGTVNQVMGDGIMALFGAPLAHEDHAVRGCYAALDLQAAMRRYAEEVRRTHGIKVQIRVGLNSGEVVVRAIGSDLHMDYTAVGQTTHLAARMEQLADPGTTLLTAETLRLAEGYVDAKPLGPVPVKGVDAPVEVYELAGAGPRRSRLHAAAVRGLTRFVGRDRELEQLRDALARAASGRGQVVAIVGEPGVGKSRLVWEVTHSHRTHGWLIAQGSSVSYGKATTFLPVIELLKGYFQVEDRDDQRKIREKVMGKLLALDRSLEPCLTAILALLDVPAEENGWQALDPPVRRQRTLDALRRLLLRESQVQPLLLIFEDLHWIDAETQALLDSLVESLPTARLLLLVNYRPEYDHRWGSKSYYTQLRLDPLPPQRAEELLQAVLGTGAGLLPLSQLLIERTEGNPFFLEESVRALVEMSVLVGERGTYRLTKAVDSVQVPATVQAILAARIDRLPPQEKALLQTASVIGKDIPYPLLQAIAEEPEAALRRGLSHLQAAEFLYETTAFPEVEHTFKHALTHDVTYGSLLQGRRRQLHGRVVEAIERLYPDRLAEHFERLCHHSERAELWEQTVAYARQAGARALGRSANRDAAAYFERGLTALARLPQADPTDGVDLRVDLRTALWAAGDIVASERVLREADQLARLLDDPQRVAQISGALAHSLRMTGRTQEAREFAARGLAIADSVDDVSVRAAMYLYAGSVDFYLGDLERAQDLLERVVHLLSGDRICERAGMVGYPAVISRGYLGIVLAERGRFAEGIHHAREGIRIAETLGQAYSLGNAWFGLANPLAIRGDWAESCRLLESGLDLCRTWSLTGMIPMMSYRLGLAYAFTGRAAEGLRLLEEASAEFATMGFDWGAMVLVALGQVYVLADRPADGLATAQRALGVARDRGERLYEAHAWWLLGEASAQVVSVDQAGAERGYRRGLALATELGMRPLVAHCHVGLGKLYGRAGAQAKAAEHLTSALTMYREMDMSFYVAQTEAARGSLPG